MDRGIGSFYNVLLVLHILSVVVGFGVLFLAPLVDARVREEAGPVGLGIARTMASVAKIGEYLIYAAVVLGILLVVASDDRISMGDAWVSVSFLLYIVAVGVYHGMVRRAGKAMDEVLAGLPARSAPAGEGRPPQVAELDRLVQQRAIGFAVIDVAVVAAVFLMVFKPGA